MTPKGKRTRVLIEPSDEERLVRALDIWAHAGDLVGLRTRAFVLLLWDGAVRTSVALALNMEEVVEDPRAKRITVRRNVVQRPCEPNGRRGRELVLSARTQKAIGDYVRAVGEGKWLPRARLAGPLFLSSFHRGTAQRHSKRSAIHWWEAFQLKHSHGCSRTYQLEDVVYSGRLKFMEAAGGDIESLSSHTGLSRRWAAEYRYDSKITPKDVMAKLDCCRERRAHRACRRRSIRRSPRI